MVDSLPHAKIIGNMRVYTTKEKANGTLDKYKTHLVAQGYLQTLGLDFTETFSPMIKLTTIRIILSITLHFNKDIM